MKFYGDLDLNDNESQQMCLELEPDFPTIPVVGRVIFKNRRVWICVQSGNTPIWITLGPKHDTYVHTQSTMSTTWTVTHNFNTTIEFSDSDITSIYPMVQVYDADGNQVITQDIEYVDNSSIVVSMGTASTGTVVCMHGDGNTYGGLITPQYTYEYTQTTPIATWVIRHWLGYTPIVRVFVGGEEVQPLSITVDDSAQVTIRFTNAVSGTARMI
jgi:hypothetical protein